MTRSMPALLPMASLVLAIGFSAGVNAQNEGGDRQLMDMVLQMQQMESEIRALRGQVEELAYELERLQRRQRDQYLDLDQRLGEMRGGGPFASGPDPGSRSANRPVQDSESAPPPRDVPEVREAVDAPSTVTAVADPQAQSQTAPATPEMEQQAYDDAFQSLKELRYADAAEQFQEFLVRYPDSDLADNAQYWLGESYYVTRNYEIALEAFQELLRQFPTSGKAGDALLKIGYTHYELKQYDQARAALEQVQEQYPGTTLSRLAESRLRSMRLEGLL